MFKFIVDKEWICSIYSAIAMNFIFLLWNLASCICTKSGVRRDQTISKFHGIWNPILVIVMAFLMLYSDIAAVSIFLLLIFAMNFLFIAFNGSIFGQKYSS